MASAPDAGAGKLSKFQKFAPRRMHRRDIKGVDYNPRQIDDYARARLKKKLETRGLLNALVVNVHPKGLGNLVSGHQRLAILDLLEGTDDYELDVNAVTLTPKQEREENVFFNNKSVQGDWDLGKLADLGQLDDFDFEAAGFTEMDIAVTFEGTEFETIFSPEEQAPEVSESMGTMADMAATRDKPKPSDAFAPYEGAPVPADEDAPNGRLENGDAIRDPERHAAVIAERNKMREKMSKANEERDSEFMVIVVCKDRDERERLMVGLGKGKDEKYLAGAELAHKCGLELE